MSEVQEKPNPKARGLGRGLNALFEDDESGFAGAVAEPSGSGRTMVGVEQLSPGFGQPRNIFDEEAIDELADSIKVHGVLQPLLVRKKGDDSYEIIAGERRWRASQKAQLHEVPVVVLDVSDSQVLEIGLVENLQREDLNPVEEARGYKKLMDEHNHTQEKLAEILGKSRPHIANTVRLLSLPDPVLKFLESGDLTMGHARALLNTPEPEILAKHVIKEGFSVRQTEKLAQEASGRKPKNKAPSKDHYKEADTVDLENDLSGILGMRVVISGNAAGAGVLKISYKSLDQLDDLVHRLSKIPKVVEAVENSALKGDSKRLLD